MWDKLWNKHAIILFYRIEIRLIAASQAHIPVPKQPCGQSAEFPLGADIRRRADNYVQPQLFRKMNEALNVMHSVKAEITLFRLVEIPRDISFNGITAHIHQLFNPVLPVFRDCSEIMERARDDFKRLSV